MEMKPSSFAGAGIPQTHNEVNRVAMFHFAKRRSYTSAMAASFLHTERLEACSCIRD